MGEVSDADLDQLQKLLDGDVKKYSKYAKDLKKACKLVKNAVKKAKNPDKGSGILSGISGFFGSTFGQTDDDKPGVQLDLRLASKIEYTLDQNGMLVPVPIPSMTSLSGETHYEGIEPIPLETNGRSIPQYDLDAVALGHCVASDGKPAYSGQIFPSLFGGEIDLSNSPVLDSIDLSDDDSDESSGSAPFKELVKEMSSDSKTGAGSRRDS